VIVIDVMAFVEYSDTVG